MKAIIIADHRRKCKRCNTSIKRGEKMYVERIGRMKPVHLHMECLQIWNKTGNVVLSPRLLDRMARL